MKIVRMRDLSRHQKERLQSGETATLAEELVADVYGLDHRPDDASWYDCVHPNSGAKTEVKSTSVRIGEKYPAHGRFRLRHDQTRSLLAADARGVAWYAFVLYDFDKGEIRIRRAKPSTVSKWVREAGGWNEAGHEEFEEQQKLPMNTVA
ncbi:hypothetical protein C5B90_05825 [Haloferax sp. Atlit-12N]|uniref:hypothetical protein n=1 Tax=Haloferax sp. Atlit-12N TaxID=2077203 RepID=UPI000E26837B|nr:hypothetical protein [Haloferax sp. Atlit-12N]RDZ65868.1 hypothetical protein C5B90_05825 [Haloferax sp. Atlit-12N]